MDSFPPLPSDSALLRAAVRGDRVARILRDYRFLRVVEARARWLAGHPVEAVDAASEELAALAGLTSPGSDAPALIDRIDAARREIRGAWSEVVESRTLSVLNEP